jgi:photosystem II stability/assembly factor-like uncharacterized protein
MAIFTYSHKILTAFLAIILFSTSSFGQWQQLGGLNGEPVYNLRSTSSELFALTSNGVLNSPNNGSSWSIVPDLYLTNSTEKISTSGDTIVVFAYPQSYLSVDNGQVWTEINEPAGGAVSVTEMIIEDGILYAATAGDYLYRSTNLGLNWTAVVAGITSPYIYEVDAFANFVFVNTDDGLFRSTDYGITFSPPPISLPALAFDEVYTNGTYVFAATDFSIYKSGNMGISWVPFDSPIIYPEITDFLVDGGSVYATSFTLLMKSDLSTANWTQVNFTQDIDYVFTVCSKGSSIYVGTNRGVFFSSNQGSTWSDANNGIFPVSVEALQYFQGKLFAGASIYGVSSYDNSWTYSGLPLFNSLDLEADGSDLYAATDYGIWKSSDTGTTWNILSPVNGPLPSFIYKIEVSDSLILGAVGQYGVLRSGDFGNTWTAENTGMLNVQVNSVVVSGTNIIVGSYNDGLYISTDAGLTWTQAAAPGEFITDVTTIGNNVFASSYSVNGNFLSTDNGLTWSNVTSGIYDELTTSGNLIIGSTIGYIEVSRDSGQTFQDLTPAPAGTVIFSNTASATDIYIGTSLDGVWRASISAILSVESANQTEGNIRFLPNLIGEEATIVTSSSTLETSPELTITDVSGRIISTIQLTKERTRFEAADLAPGIYFYHTSNIKRKGNAGKFIVY